MERSVETHTIGGEDPALDEPWLVVKGAAHYETGCQPCHGDPSLRHPAIAHAMTPHPPYLPPRISDWETDELHYIVKHGVKFTGMPAWPSQQRDDEVRAMVAFLLKLPDLDAKAYRELVDGEAAADAVATPLADISGVPRLLQAVITSCARCHGVAGLGRGAGAFPKLAGQRSEYLEASLQAYTRGARHSGIMLPIARGLGPEEMRELAGYYAALPAAEQPVGASVTDEASISRGHGIANRGVPARGVPACADCHGPGSGRRNGAYPLLAGQYAEYLALQLDLFKLGRRGGTPYAHIMNRVASGLTQQEIRDVALYFASSPPTPSASAP